MMPIPIFSFLDRQEESLVCVELLESKLSSAFIDQYESRSYFHDGCEYFRLLAKTVHGVVDDHLVQKIVIVYLDDLITKDLRC